MSKYAGFNTVQLQKPQRSQFDLSHQKRVTTRAGRLTPVLVSEAVPGDTFRGNVEILLRVAPLLAPIYDMITLYVHIFFVSYRLLWEEWEDFITGGRLGPGVEPVSAPIPPYFVFYDTLDAFPQFLAKSSLLDYLGMPIIAAIPGYNLGAFNAAGNNARFEILVPAAYQMIYMDYYRDRNFVADTAVQLPMFSGEYDQYEQILSVRTRCWEHDYFTSALPWTQRGEEVLMPLAGQGSVTYLDQAVVWNSDGTAPTYGTAFDFWSFGNAPAVDPPNTPPNSVNVIASDNGTPGKSLGFGNIDEVNITNSSVSMNDFRMAYAMQVWLERNAIAGARYTESIQAHFGVKPQDSRLQRAEYIGGGRIPVKISEIVSTAYSDDGDAIVPLANMAGHGVTYGNTNQFRYFVAEHGVILGIASIMSPTSYHQGMPRYFRRSTFLDYPWPTFAKLGEQTVDSSELYASAANLTEGADGLYPHFGYQSRYSDWKHIHNTNHGDFHDTLLFWTLTRNFGSNPVLGESFTQYDGSIQNRIFAVDQGADNFWLYVHNNVQVNRCLPYFGTPNTLGFS